LQSVGVVNNGIERVMAGVFDLMPNLTELVLIFNPLGLQHDFHVSVKNVLTTPSLLLVGFDICHISTVQLQKA
jgi:hypothetical protein